MIEFLSYTSVEDNLKMVDIIINDDKTVSVQESQGNHNGTTFTFAIPNGKYLLTCIKSGVYIVFDLESAFDALNIAKNTTGPIETEHLVKAHNRKCILDGI